MEKFILAIDQGTTSTRALLINKQGMVVNMTQEEFDFYNINGVEIENTYEKLDVI